MKDWQERITETIAFIRNAAVAGNANRREAIANVLNDRHNQNQILQATSLQMSQGTLWAVTNRGDRKRHRKYRRAIILIRVAILGDNVAVVTNNVAAIADHNLPVQLDAVLGQAYDHLKQPLRNAYNRFRHNTTAFLNNSKINMVAAAHSGRMMYGFYYEDGRQTYTFSPLDDFMNNRVHLKRRVHHVRYTLYTDVQGNIGAIPGERMNANVMVTTQLTGCSVMFEYDAGRQNLVVAHIQPGGNADGPGRKYNLVNTLRAGGGFNNGLGMGSTFRVFGSSQGGGLDDYDPGAVPPRHTYIIGVKRSNGWRLYCKRHYLMDPNDNGVSWRVL